MNQTVEALNRLSIFGPRQGGAYREHSQAVRDVLGPDVPTVASAYVAAWAESGEPGVLVLTGNAGTGKTALAEGYAATVAPEATLTVDRLEEIAPGRFVVKDLSGVAVRDRAGAVAVADGIADGTEDAQLLLCANEGVLSDLFVDDIGMALQPAVEAALRGAASKDGRVTALNMNRQRWTAPGTWARLLEYLVREDLWKDCESCAERDACPLVANAEAMRRHDVREALRESFALASAETVAPLRELLTVLAHAITGGRSCEDVKTAVATRGRHAFAAESGYFTQVFGTDLSEGRAARSPLMTTLQRLGIGQAADLQIDAWLREADDLGTPDEVRRAAGIESDGPLDRVSVGVETQTFATLGRVLTIEPDEARVSEYRRGLLGDTGHLALWRRKLFFEAPEVCAAGGGRFARLSEYRFYGDMLGLLLAIAAGRTTGEHKASIVRGMNFIACGLVGVGSELHIPDPGLLSARNPGSLIPPPPMVVIASIESPAVELVLEPVADADFLDHDDVRFSVSISTYGEELVVTPTLFEILIGAARYQTSPGLDAPEIADLRLFYAKLAARVPRDPTLRVASRTRDGLTLVKPPVLTQ